MLHNHRSLFGLLAGVKGKGIIEGQIGAIRSNRPHFGECVVVWLSCVTSCALEAKGLREKHECVSLSQQDSTPSHSEAVQVYCSGL